MPKCRPGTVKLGTNSRFRLTLLAIATLAIAGLATFGNPHRKYSTRQFWEKATVASVAEVPQVLLDQLKVGGRLAAIVGNDPIMRATFVTRTGETSWSTTQPWDTLAPRLARFPEPSKFHF